MSDLKFGTMSGNAVAWSGTNAAWFENGKWRSIHIAEVVNAAKPLSGVEIAAHYPDAWAKLSELKSLLPATG